jgi:hypothetical protein
MRDILSRVCRIRCGSRQMPIIAGHRFFHNSRSAMATSPTTSPPTSGTPPLLSRHWLSELQARIKQVSIVDISSEKRQELGRLEKQLDNLWLDLLAGQEGYLTEQEWRGIDRIPVAWGEMVNTVKITAFDPYSG